MIAFWFYTVQFLFLLFRTEYIKAVAYYNNVVFIKMWTKNTLYRKCASLTFTPRYGMEEEKQSFKHGLRLPFCCVVSFLVVKFST